MGIIRELDRLEPELAKRAKAFLSECRARGIDVLVTETLRTDDVQAAYFSRGREPHAKVRELYKKAGLYDISEAEAKTKITNCDGIKNKSNHQARDESGLGHALDIVPKKSGKAWWDAPEQVWEEIGMLAESFGLDWCAGGCNQIWGKGWDNPHFELMKNWR